MFKGAKLVLDSWYAYLPTFFVLKVSNILVLVCMSGCYDQNT